MKSVLGILHYIKSYRLLIKFNEQNLTYHKTAHTELKKISQFWITNRPRLAYQDKAITERWDKIMLEIMKCLPKYLKFLNGVKDMEYLAEEPLNIGLQVFVSSAIKYGQDDSKKITFNEIKIWKRFFHLLFEYYKQDQISILIEKINENLSFDDTSFDLAILQSTKLITSYYAVLNRLADQGTFLEYSDFTTSETFAVIKSDFLIFAKKDEFCGSTDSLFSILEKNDQESRGPLLAIINKYLYDISIQILKVVSLLSDFGKIASHYCCSGILYQLLNISFYNIPALHQNTYFLGFRKSVQNYSIRAARKILIVCNEARIKLWSESRCEDELSWRGAGNAANVKAMLTSIEKNE
jgi:hypothetical protein